MSFIQVGVMGQELAVMHTTLQKEEKLIKGQTGTILSQAGALPLGGR